MQLIDCMLLPIAKSQCLKFKAYTFKTIASKPSINYGEEIPNTTRPWTPFSELSEEKAPPKLKNFD